MTQPECLTAFDEILELPSGTLHGSERLEDLENWNSLTILSVIAFADEHFGVTLSAKDLVGCGQVDDILCLLGVLKTA